MDGESDRRRTTDATPRHTFHRFLADEADTVNIQLLSMVKWTRRTINIKYMVTILNLGVTQRQTMSVLLNRINRINKIAELYNIVGVK